MRGGISVAVPLAPIREVTAAGASALRSTHLSAWLIGMALIGFGSWRLGRESQQLVNSNAELRQEVDYRKRVEAKLREEIARQEQLLQALRQTQEQLLQSEKLASIGQLAVGVAHEINNPVGFVKSNLSQLNGYTAALLELDSHCRNLSATQAPVQLHRLLAEKRQQLDIDYIQKEIVDLLSESQEGIQRVEKIVADLKQFARRDNQAWDQVDLHEIIESSLNLVRNETKHGITILRDFADLPPVRIMPTQITQVLVNLLINATQAIEGEGEIRIASGRLEDAVWIEITDSGVGMDAEALRHLFEPFFTTKPVGAGTGLGLSVSYGIVQAHGGKIDVSSAVGVGTTCIVHLPIDQIAAA